MALVLKGCTDELCDGFKWTDSTGLYDAATNPGGYGVQNDITGPSGFTTYTIRLWAPSANPATDAPTFTYDLLADVPTPDSDDHYTWEFDPGLQVSGVWYSRTVATFNGDTFEVNAYVTFSNEVRGLIRDAINATDPTCACKEGCEDPYRLLTLLNSVVPCGCACATVCSLDRVRTIIAYLHSRLPLCNC